MEASFELSLQTFFPMLEQGELDVCFSAPLITRSSDYYFYIFIFRVFLYFNGCIEYLKLQLQAQTWNKLRQ